MMEKIKFQIHEKEITLYPAQGGESTAYHLEYGDGRWRIDFSCTSGSECTGL